MARIAGVDLPRRKHLAYALPYLYGIGRTTAKEICQKAKIPENKRVEELSDAEVKSIRDDPRRRLQGRGRSAARGAAQHQAADGPRLLPRLRHRRGLPVNGQRTHTNSRTRKGPRKGMLQRRPAAAAPKP